MYTIHAVTRVLSLSLQLSAELRPCICRTDCVLGRHYSYLGFRLIQFDPDCEGNRHITNEDL